MSFGPLFERSASSPVVPAGLPLVVLLTGFTDAGNTVAGLIEHARDSWKTETVVSYRNDALLDYRARRPLIKFDTDHLVGYRPPRLELSLAQDSVGQPFLLLSGYEPDFAWESFVDSIVSFVTLFDVANVTWVHAIGMPVPHTRPLGTTVSGNRPELTAVHSVWRPRTKIPATAGHLLEYSLANEGRSVAGFVLLVPHYLADTDYPETVVVALEKIMAATGLVFTLDDYRESVQDFRDTVDEQVRDQEEVATMVSTLEQRYDSYMSGFAVDAEGEGFSEEHLPSADELAAELERYLANRAQREEPGGDSNS